jgi:hypothetical protein
MKKYEDGGKVDEMSKKNTKGYKQTYSDMTKENEGVRETMMAPIKKVKKMFSKEEKKAVHKMPDGTMMKGAKHGMKKGGSVKSIDGIAVRGKTRCK